MAGESLQSLIEQEHITRYQTKLFFPFILDQDNFGLTIDSYTTKYVLHLDNSSFNGAQDVFNPFQFDFDKHIILYVTWRLRTVCFLSVQRVRVSCTSRSLISCCWASIHKGMPSSWRLLLWSVCYHHLQVLEAKPLHISFIQTRSTKIVHPQPQRWWLDNNDKEKLQKKRNIKK